MYHSHEKEPRYSLKTLKALHYGAVHENGTVRLLINDDTAFPYTASVQKVGPSGLFVRMGDGTVVSDVDPDRVLYAEVV